MYPDDGKKPPLGEGLNKKAQITLDKVWPTDKVSLKGHCHEIFDFRVFSYISFPQIPKSPIRAFSNFFRSSRCTTGKWKKVLIMLFGHLWVVELTFKMTLMLFLEAWGQMIHEKKHEEISRPSPFLTYFYACWRRCPQDICYEVCLVGEVCAFDSFPP